MPSHFEKTVPYRQVLAHFALSGLSLLSLSFSGCGHSEPLSAFSLAQAKQSLRELSTGARGTTFANHKSLTPGERRYHHQQRALCASGQ